MKYRNVILISIIFFYSLINCKRDILFSCDDLIIDFKTECGWCGGEEILKITYLEIKYERNIPCGENKGIIKRSKSINEAKWDSIVSSFDYDLFETLEYTECNVCVDGCDEGYSSV